LSRYVYPATDLKYIVITSFFTEQAEIKFWHQLQDW